jgi:hypothetical protein
MTMEEKLAKYPNLTHTFTSDQDREQCRINGAKGHAVQRENRRKAKRMNRAMKWLLQSKDVISDEDIRERLVKLGVVDEDDEGATNAEVLALVALRKAAKGDVEALKFVRDTAGEAPKNQVELSGDLDRPVATLDLRAMSEEELLRMVEERSGETADESGADKE